MEIMLEIIFGAALGLIPAYIARKKGRSFNKWWFYGFLLWIVALPHSILIKPVKLCPLCKEVVAIAATVCKHCKREI